MILESKSEMWKWSIVYFVSYKVCLNYDLKEESIINISTFKFYIILY